MELASLALLGIVWGLLYGVIMNLWFWPFASGPEAQTWQAGSGIMSAVQRYSVFYLATSFLWDLARALGTGFLILLLGSPTLQALRRFQRRFAFHYTPAIAPPTPGESRL